MKVKCIKSSRQGSVQVGKVYEAQAVPCDTSQFFHGVIELKNIKLFLFNDHGQWKVYPPHLFVPATARKGRAR